MINMNRRQALKIGLATAGGLLLPKIAKAQEETLINCFERPNIIKNVPYGNIDWNTLRTREQRIELLNEFLEEDKTDEKKYIKNVWDCTEFSFQTYINFTGYKDEENIPSKYDIRNNGKFNLPVQNVAILAPSLESGHSINSILVGDNPLNFNDWYFFEPQDDKEVKIGGWSMPDDTLWVSMFDFKFTAKGFKVEKYLFDFNIENGVPNLNYYDSNILLTRPTQTLVSEETLKTFSLKQNYPNPFNSSTAISYSLDKPGKVELNVFNIYGQHLDTLVDGNQSAGKHNVRWNAENYGSGTYFYRLRTKDGEMSKKMTLMR